MAEKNLSNLKIRLNCSNCGEFLAYYNPETKLYKPHIPISYQQDERFFELPVKFFCKCKKNKKEYSIEKNQFIQGKKFKCEFCNKILARFYHTPELDLQGILIHLNYATDIECGNRAEDCLKCGLSYNLEKLKNKDNYLGIEIG